MRIEDLSIFTEVIRYHSMNIAAEKHFMTPQNLGKIIRHMEQELGVVLFKRSKKGSELTEAGEKFYLQILKVLNAYQKALELINQTPGEEKEPGGQPESVRIKVLCNQGAPNHAVLSAYKQLQREKRYDAFMELEMMRNYDYQQMSQELVEKKADIAVCLVHENDINDFIQCCSGYIPMYILQSEYMLIVSKSNPLAVRSVVSVEEICQQKFIAVKDNSGYQEIFGDQVPCVMRIDSMNSTIDQVIYSDDYCTLVCKCLFPSLKEKEDRLAFIPIDKKIYGTFIVLLREDLSGSSAVQAFVKMIGQTFFETPGISG